MSRVSQLRERARVLIRARQVGERVRLWTHSSRVDVSWHPHGIEQAWRDELRGPGFLLP
ncbi:MULTISPECIES: hypothetical protein [unclassified Paenibacillus]|uniref:hypothetical protein n=1 Tax=unclassified Paenibacillus TaxID=185978 RepID=UPI0015A41C3D|nr:MULTISPECIES: hypothetical protein [unclassified Paenibacillus]